jgi:5-(carboxyamino)imidazole ribonucleotide synthase
MRHDAAVSHDLRPGPILPPATIGILGGGQLGRMLGFAARAMGYRIVVLDPDPGCPAAAIADRVEVGGYGDVAAALRMAEGCAVVTYELEHLDAAVVDALADRLPVRPGALPLRVTQDRLAERRFVEGAGVPVAPWRELRSGDAAGLADAVRSLGLPLRLKAVFGGYDGRSQIRVATDADLAGAWATLGRPDGQPVLAEAELAFAEELSVVCARATDGRLVPFPAGGNRHDAGILVETVQPAPVPAPVAAEAAAIAQRLAEAMDLVGLLTVELFRMPDDRLVVNELAPRVHNSGHATIDGAQTSQFEQQVRAICGLPLGAPDPLAPAAMVNLLGAGPRRPARLLGVEAALADPAVHLHLYDKREVAERRKMGHLTAVAPTTGEALDRAHAALARLRWADDGDGLPPPGARPERA